MTPARKPPTASPPAPARAASALRFAGSLLAWMLVAVRTLYPSEDAAMGSGIWILPVELLLPALVCLAALLEPDPALRALPRVGAAGWLWAAFLGLLWASALASDYRLPAVLMAAEWTGVVAVWWGIRSSGKAPSHAAAALVALATTQAGLAFWQVGVDLPALRESYTRRDPEIRRQLAELGIEPGTPAEEGFRNRILATEPFGSFGHPNSLAALLLLGMVVAASAAMSPGDRLRSAFAGLWALALAAALLLTKSRAAWLAALLAFPLVLLVRAKVGRRAIALAALAGAAGLLGAAMSLAWVGILDREVLTETTKSFSYRWEWWQGTMGVLEERPLLGVGFGGFGDYYLRHKLPFSSEEIKDPHHFVLEIAASAGLPAAAAYLALLAAVGWSILRGNWPANPSVRRTSSGWVGLCAGALLVAACAPSGWAGWQGLAFTLLSVAVVGATWPDVDERGLARSLLIGAGAVHLNWLASGGIGFPGLLLPVWAALAAAEPPPPAPGRPCRWAVLGAIAAAWSLALAAFLLGIWLPWRRVELLAAQTRTVDRGKAALDAAAAAWPANAALWRQLAAAHAASMRSERKAADYHAAIAAIERAIQLEPRSAAGYWMMAQVHEQAARTGIEPCAIERALAAARESLARYPTIARRHYQLGLWLWELGREAEALESLEAALELDQTPHPDKKLSGDERRRALAILARKTGSSR